MAEVTYLEAIRQGLFEEMERDPNVLVLGEDIATYGGAFKGYADIREPDCGREFWNVPYRSAAC